MKRDFFAPIALFVYNRLEHTQRTIEALVVNDLARDSELVVFSDGAKDSDGEYKVNQVREYIATVDGFASVRVIHQEKNIGLANSIISGVTSIVDVYGRVIVLEDDLITSPHFLRFMNDALDFYKNHDEVASINAYMYPIPNLPEIFFLRASDSWGWGTWARAWKIFEPNGEKLLERIIADKKCNIFDFYGYYPYLDMLKDQIVGKNNSWAIRWSASTLVENKLGLYLGKSLVQNIGLDGTGRHCGKVDEESNKYWVALDQSSIDLKFIEPQYDSDACKRVGRYMSKNLFSWRRRLLSFLKSTFRVLSFF